MRRRWQGRELGDRDIRKGRELVWERFLSRCQGYAWWQSSLSFWLVEARRFFCTTSRLIRELAYQSGKRLDDRKVHYPFLDTCLTTESGPSFTFKTRHLGGSETIVKRIPRLWSVKLPGFGLNSERPNRQAFAMYFGRLEDRNAPRIRRPFLS